MDIYLCLKVPFDTYKSGFIISSQYHCQKFSLIQELVRNVANMHSIPCNHMVNSVVLKMISDMFCENSNMKDDLDIYLNQGCALRGCMIYYYEDETVSFAMGLANI